MAINIIMFLALLFHKIRNKKKVKKDEARIIIYRNLIKRFITGESKELPNLRNKRSISMVISIIMEEIDSSSDYERYKLLELSREIGLVKSELEALNKGNKSRKAIAAYRLGELAAVESIGGLLANIDKDNKELSYIIFRSLVLLGGTEYLDKIIDYFDEGDFTYKARILELISGIDRVDIYPKMKEYLEGEDTLRRVLAFESLGDRGDERLIPYIGEAIASDNKELRIAGLKGIIATSPPDCKKLLSMVSHLKDDPEWEVRAFLARSLRVCQDSRESISILKALAEDSHYLVRFNAAERLFEFGEAGLVALSDILHSKDKFAREKAWSLIKREIRLYDLMDKIKDYSSYECIISNIEAYDKSIEGGVLVGAE